MPLDRIVEIVGRETAVEAPTGSTWRTFGSPVGAGKVRRSALTPEPAEYEFPWSTTGPWRADPDDSSFFRELRETRFMTIFAGDDALVEEWLDTQADDEAPRYWDWPEPRALSAQIDPEYDVAPMVGTRVVIRGREFGTVQQALLTTRSGDQATEGRNAYDRIDFELDRDAPTLTFTDGFNDFTNWNESQYVWGYLDVVRLFRPTRTRVWAEVVDQSSVDADWSTLATWRT